MGHPSRLAERGRERGSWIMRLRVALTVCVLCATGPAVAANWIENTNGDLSNSGLAPSLLSLQAGSNFIRGGFGTPDLDYLTVLVPTGHVLSAIVTGLENNQGL